MRLGLAIDYGNLADAVSREGNYGEAFSAADNAIKITSTGGREITPELYSTIESQLSVLSQIQSEDPSNVDCRLRLAATSNKIGP